MASVRNGIRKMHQDIGEKVILDMLGLGVLGDP